MTEEIRALSVVERFRESHHAIARMVAAGMTDAMIRQRTGISFRRLALYHADPTFNELVRHYEQVVEEKWNANIDAYLDLGMSNMLRAEGEISDRLDDDELRSALSVAVLDKISQGRADRFGYGRNQTLNINVDFAAALDKAIARSGKGPEGGPRLIEVQASSSQTPQPVPREVPASQPPLTVGPGPQPSFAGVLEVKRRRVA